MYFTKGKRRTYHILHYLDSGSAPPPCGAKANSYDLKLFKEGRPAPSIVAERPPDGALCKHCEAATHKQTGGAD